MTFTPEPRELYAVVELQPANGPATRTEHLVMGWFSQFTGQTAPLFFEPSHAGGAVVALADLYSATSCEVRVTGYRVGQPSEVDEAVPSERDIQALRDHAAEVDRIVGRMAAVPPPVSGAPCAEWVEYGGAKVLCELHEDHDEHYGTTHQHSVTWSYARLDGFVNGIITTVIPLPEADHGLVEQATMMFERAAWIQGYAAGQSDMDAGVTYLDGNRYRNPFGPRQAGPAKRKPKP